MSSTTPLTASQLDQLQTRLETWLETGASEFPISIWQLQRLIIMARNSSQSLAKGTSQ